MQHIIRPLNSLIVSPIRQDIRHHRKLQLVQIPLDGFGGFYLLGFFRRAHGGAHAVAGLQGEGQGAEAEVAGAACYEDELVVGHCKWRDGSLFLWVNERVERDDSCEDAISNSAWDFSLLLKTDEMIEQRSIRNSYIFHPPFHSPSMTTRNPLLFIIPTSW